MAQQTTKGTYVTKNSLNEKQTEAYYANMNIALDNVRTLINGRPVYKNLMRYENGITINITVDLDQATK